MRLFPREFWGRVEYYQSYDAVERCDYCTADRNAIYDTFHMGGRAVVPYDRGARGMLRFAGLGRLLCPTRSKGGQEGSKGVRGGPPNRVPTHGTDGDGASVRCSAGATRRV